MNLVHLYTSGSRDIALFNLLFIFYGISSIALIFGLLKLSRQNVTFTRFLSGIFVFFIGTIVIFDVWFGMIKQFGQQIPSPAAGMLLILIGLSIGSSLMFATTLKLVFRLKDISKSTIRFLAVQPLLIIMFFAIVIFSGI
jgi:hypothetical protein